jgi:hypothetical protein
MYTGVIGVTLHEELFDRIVTTPEQREATNERLRCLEHPNELFEELLLDECTHNFYLQQLEILKNTLYAVKKDNDDDALSSFDIHCAYLIWRNAIIPDLAFIDPQTYRFTMRLPNRTFKGNAFTWIIESLELLRSITSKSFRQHLRTSASETEMPEEPFSPEQVESLIEWQTELAVQTD